ncbi:hypothetical protein [Parerythrobacter lacustris]|uniref:Lipoprotein n=1 Tax=Parerythrobacter lacustris TaxID=2969984 RepID=A0ABT1XLM9_9SPHN|nr:hypothetical protein [Parerythrobacter lacustris]MCR2832482.1 hypothetical protein [Parerythrobacter lacustris]
MRFARFSLWACAALALASCGGLDEGSESGDAPAPTAEQAELNAAPQFASTYTDFDLAKCEVLSEEREEGSSAEYRCPGFGELPLLVQEGDGRFDLDAGGDDGGFQTIGAFNDIGDTVEWRLKNGQPFAVIFRFLDVTEEAKGRTVLAVETVTRLGLPACRVAQIAGDTPDANQKARELADAAATEGFRCPDEPELLGNAQ